MIYIAIRKILYKKIIEFSISIFLTIILTFILTIIMTFKWNIVESHSR